MYVKWKWITTSNTELAPFPQCKVQGKCWVIFHIFSGSQASHSCSTSPWWDSRQEYLQAECLQEDTRALLSAHARYVPEMSRILTLCLPRSSICTSVKLPRSPICTVIHTPIVHSICSMKRFLFFLVRTVRMRYQFGFLIFHTIQRVENSTSKNAAPIPVRSKIMWQTGFVRGKQRVNSWCLQNCYFLMTGKNANDSSEIYSRNYMASSEILEVPLFRKSR